MKDPALANGSPWRCVQRHAERFVDASGLRPWWVLDGAEIRRHVFERPFGRDIARFAQLREQRMIYRLALGQPNQEDFIDVLSRGGKATRTLLQPLILDLSAMGLRTKAIHASGIGQSPISIAPPPVSMDEDMSARPPPAEATAVDRAMPDRTAQTFYS
ncbi:hypothetical protein AAFX91_23605 [Bradyrhizobium sp. 31Argb]|uniref:hypothetical protein n=1 Tax=Bradyrhizobium sp. 31Argb TaxID=3141247 RepID=UPI00374A8B34